MVVNEYLYESPQKFYTQDKIKLLNFIVLQKEFKNTDENDMPCLTRTKN